MVPGACVGNGPREWTILHHRSPSPEAGELYFTPSRQIGGATACFCYYLLKRCGSPFQVLVAVQNWAYGLSLNFMPRRTLLDSEGPWATITVESAMTVGQLGPRPLRGLRGPPLLLQARSPRKVGRHLRGTAQLNPLLIRPGLHHGQRAGHFCLGRPVDGWGGMRPAHYLSTRDPWVVARERPVLYEIFGRQFLPGSQPGSTTR
jgi:hypothetical protein